ncbi:unnamed protein product [Mycena citricolor]|uniref:Uncharacterized protein n=1 Tax=Mycena citricolor TaxID=2018698 RepID=A0AAD2H485_9AGAR|nr:unnamed protein product [Mycena citricolor]CAK5269971.1 unnamed protein product [Mycena citricolor]
MSASSSKRSVRFLIPGGNLELDSDLEGTATDFDDSPAISPWDAETPLLLSSSPASSSVPSTPTTPITPITTLSPIALSEILTRIPHPLAHKTANYTRVLNVSGAAFKGLGPLVLEALAEGDETMKAEMMKVQKGVLPAEAYAESLPDAEEEEEEEDGDEDKRTVEDRGTTTDLSIAPEHVTLHSATSHLDITIAHVRGTAGSPVRVSPPISLDSIPLPPSPPPAAPLHPVETHGDPVYAQAPAPLHGPDTLPQTLSVSGAFGSMQAGCVPVSALGTADAGAIVDPELVPLPSSPNHIPAVSHSISAEHSDPVSEAPSQKHITSDAFATCADTPVADSSPDYDLLQFSDVPKTDRLELFKRAVLPPQLHLDIPISPTTLEEDLSEMSPLFSPIDLQSPGSSPRPYFRDRLFSESSFRTQVKAPVVLKRRVKETPRPVYKEMGVQAGVGSAVLEGENEILRARIEALERQVTALKSRLGRVTSPPQPKFLQLKQLAATDRVVPPPTVFAFRFRKPRKSGVR